MNLELHRIAKLPKYTIGKLYIDGKYFCDTLEDTDRGLDWKDSAAYIREKKIHSETAIPKGTYKLIVNYSPRFKRNLPRLLDVPGFDGILIHRGNTAADTAGCILVGENSVVGKVLNSTPYEQKLTAMLEGGEHKITIR